MQTKKNIHIWFDKDLFSVFIFLVLLTIISLIIIRISYIYVDRFLMISSSSILWLIYFIIIISSFLLTFLLNNLINNFCNNYKKKTWNNIIFQDKDWSSSLVVGISVYFFVFVFIWLILITPQNFLYAGFTSHWINNNYIYKKINDINGTSVVLRTEKTQNYKEDLVNLSCLLKNLSSNNIQSFDTNKLEIKNIDCNPHYANYQTINIKPLIIDMLDKKETIKKIELKILNQDKIIKWELVVEQRK